MGARHYHPCDEQYCGYAASCCEHDAHIEGEDVRHSHDIDVVRRTTSDRRDWSLLRVARQATAGSFRWKLLARVQKSSEVVVGTLYWLAGDTVEFDCQADQSSNDEQGPYNNSVPTGILEIRSRQCGRYWCDQDSDSTALEGSIDIQVHSAINMHCRQHNAMKSGNEWE